MGKRALINMAINLVGLIVYHKVLFEKGMNIDAKKHLEKEIREYTLNTINKLRGIRFSESDFEEIKEKSIKNSISVLLREYSDVIFSEDETEKIVDETIKEVFDGN